LACFGTPEPGRYEELLEVIDAAEDLKEEGTIEDAEDVGLLVC